MEFLRKRKRLYHHSTEESLLETIQERNSIIIFPWMIFKCLTNTKTFLNFVGLWNEKLQNIQHQFLSEEKIHTHLYTYLYIYMKKKNPILLYYRLWIIKRGHLILVPSWMSKLEAWMILGICCYSPVPFHSKKYWLSVGTWHLKSSCTIDPHCKYLYNNLFIKKLLRNMS